MPTSLPADRYLRERDEDAELFYVEGTSELRAARLNIARYSIPKAKERVLAQKRKREEEEAIELELDPETIKHHFKEQKQAENKPDEVAILIEKLKKFELQSSEVGDDRPMSSCAISPDSKLIATSGWSGLCKIFDAKTLQITKILKGHRERASSIVWHPNACNSQSSSAINLASGGVDLTIKFWSLDSDEPLSSLAGHVGRINRVAFHPSGRYIASSSYDNTWRLWDVEVQKQVLIQEGHSRAVYGLAYQCDGSLLATTGVDAIGRIWDLRTGKSIVVLQGHVKEVLAVDFHPNGYQLVTGSDDHTVRIWDLRKKKICICYSCA